MTDIVFPDPHGYADLATLVGRARRADPDAALRLVASGTRLVVWVGVLPGSGLLADGAVVGVRATELAQAVDLDVVVSAAALAERFDRDEPAARGRPGERATEATVPADPLGEGDRGSAARDRGPGPVGLTVPPAGAFAPWAGALPGAGGWAPVGSLPSSRVEAAARSGVAEIGAGLKGGLSTLAAQALRSQVWGRRLPLDGSGEAGSGADRHGERAGQTAGVGLPAGAAFAAYALGFLREDGPELTVYRNGRWLRLRAPAGHVLTR